MSYNGVELPDVNGVWDKSTYSYATLFAFDSGEVNPAFSGITSYLLSVSTNQFGWCDEWGLVGPHIERQYLCTTNANIAAALNGSVYTWYEWSGSSSDSSSFATEALYCDLVWASYDVYGYDDATHSFTSEVFYKSSESGSGGGVEPPPVEGGSGSLDFSKATLRVFDSNVLGTKADWACRWYGVPNLDPPDNVYYFFEFSASSAGHTVSSVPFFMGSNEICPDGEYEFFIENLQPSTTYSGVLKLVYNTTGEWSGFTDTGVTYSFSFTTAESDPVTPDEPDEPGIPVDPDEPDVPGGDSGGVSGDNQDVIGAIKDSNKEVIDAIEDSSAADREWIDEQYSSGVGSLPDDVVDFDGLVDNLDATEEAYKNEAFARFQEISSSFNGFDGSVGSGISLAGTLFSRFFSALGSYKIVYTFPLLLAVVFVAIGRLGRSSFKHERSDHDQFLIDGW